MEPVILENIPFDIDLNRLRSVTHTDRDSALHGDLMRLAREAQELARPKALYRVAGLDSRDEDGVIIEGVRLSSRVLSVNLSDVRRVFLYLATCGAELDAWAHALDDMLYQFWAEEIKVMALNKATRAVFQAINDRFRPGKTTSMNPGSLQDWPLGQQRPFFQLLEAAGAIGVTLSDSCLMSPNKSVSGLRYQTEEGFESCQLCPMPDCPGRRAPYEPDLYRKKYALEE